MTDKSKGLSLLFRFASSRSQVGVTTVRKQRGFTPWEMHSEVISLVLMNNTLAEATYII